MNRCELIEQAKILIIPFVQTEEKTKKFDHSEITKNHEYVRFTENDYTKDDLYTDSINTHHFKTKWHYKNTIPALNKLLNININENDFYLIDDGEYSFLLSKKLEHYTIVHTITTIFNENTEMQCIDVKFSQRKLTSNEISGVSRYVSKNLYREDIKASKYHRLFKCPHEISILHNDDNENGRTLFLSCDSHMIPIIPILIKYFEEIIVFDNRYADSNISFFDILSIEEKNITDVLFQIWENTDLKKYIKYNLY